MGDVPQLRLAPVWTKLQVKETVNTWTQLLGYCEPTEIPSGTRLFQEGDSAQDVFLLVDGLVLLTCSLSAEAEETLGLRIPGQIIEHCAHTLSRPYPVSARALVRSKVFRISALELRHKKLTNPNVGLFFEQALCFDLWQAMVFIVQLKQSSPADRLRNFLHFLASAAGQKSLSGRLAVRMPLPSDQVAAILGLSARQFKRIKKQMMQAGQLELLHRKIWVLFGEK